MKTLCLFRKESYETNRFVSIGLLKFFAAILVVLSHCILKYVNKGDETPFFNYIWITQMPLFMFGSGFVSFPNKIDKFSSFIRKIGKSFSSLVIPCLTFIIIESIILSANPIDLFSLFFLNPQTGLWFLWVLFLIHVVFYFFTYISKKINSSKYNILLFLFGSLTFIGLSLLLLLDFNSDILGYKLFVYYLPYYYFGYLFYLLVTNTFFNHKVVRILYIIIIFLSLFFTLFSIFYFDSIYSFDDGSFALLLIRYAAGICSIIIHFTLFDLLSRYRLMNKMSFLGNYSLECYFLHIIVLRFFNYSVDGFWLQHLVSFSTCVLVLLVVSVLLIAIYFIPFLHSILFGRSWSYYDFEKNVWLLLKKRLVKNEQRNKN